jgi:PKD repeat protein
MKNILLYILLLLTLTTCSKQSQDSTFSRKPVAGFVINNENCKSPCVIAFINTSRITDDTKYIWEFGDGDSSRLENPFHQYETGGVYNVQLTAQNKTGFSIATSKVTIQSDLPLGFFNLCRIDRVTYVKLPPTKPDGKPWDDLPNSSALPDLQWLVRDTTRTYIRGQELSELVNFDQKLLPFTVPREGLSGAMRQFGQIYTLVVQDADESGPEIIGSFKFRPLDHFPPQTDKATAPSASQTQHTFKSDDGLLELRVTFTWQ